jgi:hypothetical protein
MADNFQVKDATGANIAKASREIAAGIHMDKVVLADNAGAVLSALPVSQSGSWSVGQSGNWTVQQGSPWTVALGAGATVSLGAGSADIGDVGIVPGSQIQLAAGTAAIGTVTISSSSKITLRDAAGTDITTANPLPVEVIRRDAAGAAAAVKFAPIVASASGNTAVVAAVTGKRIRVLSYSLIAAGTASVKFQSATTDITGTYPLVANTGLSDNGGEAGVFQTGVAETLHINLSAAVAVGGRVTYIEV